MIWSAPPIWEGERCWILAGGYSWLKQFNVDAGVADFVCKKLAPESTLSDFLTPIHSEHVIGINNVYRIGNWIDVLFFGDCGWFLVHEKPIKHWPGLKVTCCDRFASRRSHQMEGLKYLAKDREHNRGITTDRSKVSWNSNSGAAAISLAAHFGVRQILLLGMDMNMQQHSHWHGSHDPKARMARKPAFKRHLLGFPQIAEDAKRLGIEIVNVNPDSAIDVFPKANLKDVL